MISDEIDAPDEPGAASPRTWRRGVDVLDDYAGGGVLSEQLADDLVNDLLGLVGDPRTGAARPHRSRRGPGSAARPGPRPSRPVTPPPSTRPRLTLVRGGADQDSFTATSTR